MYAIVDIETTGSYASANGITEISIHVYDGEKVVETFETLINPQQPIPYFIQAMTGITDSMVSDAPLFEEVAEKIFSILQNNIFVAHNVSFDYSFVNAHLKTCGYELNSKKLCTVRLSRKIFPGFASYSLGKLCDSLDIKISNRHRAGGDTAATVKVFELLLQNDKEQHIAKALQRNSKDAILPPNVPKEHFTQLPYTPGVYYFHNEKGKVVYVGKANNIKYRVNSHFSNNSQSRQKQNFMQHVHGISYQSCGTELMACILESTEIKKRWPIFNTSQKRWDYLADVHAIVRKLIKEHNLCPKLCFLQTDNDSCIGIKEKYCFGACEQTEPPEEYNQRINEAVASLQLEPSFIIKDKGINGDDQSCILVLNGHLYGMGYLQADIQITDVETLKEQLTEYKENSFTRNLVRDYAIRFPEKVIMLENSIV